MSPGAAAVVRLDVEGQVAVLTLDRPSRRNALDADAITALAEQVGHLTRVIDDGAVRAAVVTGAGGSFCAGRDISGVDPRAEDAGDVLADQVNPVIARLADLPVPTFAAVEGPALGIGLGLALACDVVLAAQDARLGSPFGRIGAVLDSGAHLFLADRIGRSRTLGLVYTGRLLDGREAAAWGVADQVVSAGTALDEALALAGAAATGPTAAFAGSKRLLAKVRDGERSLAAVLALEAEAQRRAGRTQDYLEGFTAFQEKRAPRFNGR